MDMAAKILKFRRPTVMDPGELYADDVQGVIHGKTPGEDDVPLELYVAVSLEGVVSFIIQSKASEV